MHEKEGLAEMSFKRRWSFGRWEIFSASIYITPRRRHHRRRLQRREQQFHGNIHARVVIDYISGDYRPKS